MEDHLTISRIIKQASTRRAVGSYQIGDSREDRISRRRHYRFIALLIWVLLAWHPAFGWAQAVELGGDSQAGVAGEGEGGIGILSRLPFNFSLGIRGGYDDNTNTDLSGSGSGGGSSSTTGIAYVSCTLPGQRFYLSLRAGGEFTYYPDATMGQSNSTNTYLDLSLQYNVSERFQLTDTVDVIYQTEPDFRSDVGLQNVRSNFLNATDTISASYSLTQRTSFITSFSFNRIKYDDSSIGFFQDRVEETFGETIRYSLLPVTTSLVLDYRFQVIDYDSFPLDSTSHIILIGFDEGLTPQLKITARGGATFRSYADSGDTIDPDVEATLTYTGAHNSRLSWENSYSLEEPNSLFAQSRTTFRTGLNASYGLSDRISATAAVYYHHDENQGFASVGGTGGSFASDAFDVSLGLHYVIQGGVSVDFSFQRSEVNSGMASQNYSRNQYSAGFTYTY